MFKPEIYTSRRDRLREKLASGLVLIPGNTEASFNYPANTYHFRQDSDFLYFFGLDSPDLAGVMDIDSGEDLSINSAVNAMMLWVTPAIVYPGWFTDILKGRAELREFNPIELVRPGLPPAIFFQGTADDTVPFKSVEAYVKKARSLGNRCDFEVYEGQTHLIWGENAQDVLKKMDAFLESLGYL